MVQVNLEVPGTTWLRATTKYCPNVKFTKINAPHVCTILKLNSYPYITRRSKQRYPFVSSNIPSGSFNNSKLKSAIFAITLKLDCTPENVKTKVHRPLFFFGETKQELPIIDMHIHIKKAYMSSFFLQNNVHISQYQYSQFLPKGIQQFSPGTSKCWLRSPGAKAATGLTRRRTEWKDVNWLVPSACRTRCTCFPCRLEETWDPALKIETTRLTAH